MATEGDEMQIAAPIIALEVLGHRRHKINPISGVDLPPTFSPLNRSPFLFVNPASMERMVYAIFYQLNEQWQKAPSHFLHKQLDVTVTSDRRGPPRPTCYNYRSRGPPAESSKAVASRLSLPIAAASGCVSTVLNHNRPRLPETVNPLLRASALGRFAVAQLDCCHPGKATCPVLNTEITKRTELSLCAPIT